MKPSRCSCQVIWVSRGDKGDMSAPFPVLFLGPPPKRRPAPAQAPGRSLEPGSQRPIAQKWSFPRTPLPPPPPPEAPFISPLWPLVVYGVSGRLLGDPFQVL